MRLGFPADTATEAPAALPLRQSPRSSRIVKKLILPLVAMVFQVAAATAAETILSGKAAVDADWTADAPGVRHKLTVEDLPPPYQTESVTNDASVVDRPPGAQPKVPNGFKIEQYAAGFKNPRYLLTAPNG